MTVWLNGTHPAYRPLDDLLRAAGVHQIVTAPGWKTTSRRSNTQGFPSNGPYGVVVHHTASAPRSTPGKQFEIDFNFLTSGHPDRPVGNLLLGPEGQVGIVAAGSANCQGKGGPILTSRGAVPKNEGNSYLIAIEASNSGQGQVWPAVQQDAYVRIVAQLCRDYGFKETDVVSHEEWTRPSCPGRKCDPAGPSRWSNDNVGGCTAKNLWVMDRFRASVKQRLALAGSAETFTMASQGTATGTPMVNLVDGGLGIDISVYQGEPDFDLVATEPYTFIGIQLGWTAVGGARDRNEMVLDAQYRRNVEEIRRRNRWALIHYVVPVNRPWQEQHAAIIAALGELPPHGEGIMFDIEYKGAIDLGFPALRDLMDATEQHYQVPVAHYGEHFIRDDNHDRIKIVPHYGKATNAVPGDREGMEKRYAGVQSIAIWQSGGGKNGNTVPGILGGTSRVDTDVIINADLVRKLVRLDNLLEDPDMATEFLFRFRGYDNIYSYPSLAPVFGALLANTATDIDGTVVQGPYKDTPFVVATVVHGPTVKAINARNGLAADDWMRTNESLNPEQKDAATFAGLTV